MLSDISRIELVIKLRYKAFQIMEFYKENVEAIAKNLIAILRMVLMRTKLNRQDKSMAAMC
jgi:hypothetical protein